MKRRIWELDFLRGFAIIMMIFDHLMYDFMYMPVFFSNFNQVDNPTFNWLSDMGLSYWLSGLRFFGHFFFVALFLIISGISFTFSKNNLSRGLKLSIVAILITLVTFTLDYFLSMEMIIVFGIIHLYALSIILTYLIRKLIKNEIVILVISLIVIFVGFLIKFYNPVFLASFSWAELWKIIIGINAYGADYFGLIPYFGFILLGTVLGKAFYSNRQSLIPQVNIPEKNIVMIAGRRSLLIFITHQIVLIALIYIIGFIFGYRY